VRADEKLTAFVELEAEISHAQASAEPHVGRGLTKDRLNER
jgi:hypothetical protein